MHTSPCPECRSPNVSLPDPVGTTRCYACGLHWEADAPGTQRYPTFRQPPPESTPALGCCAICTLDQDDLPTLILARDKDQDICTDCLANTPGQDDNEAAALGLPPLMTQQAYRAQGGGACPQCHSGDVAAGRMTFEAGIIGQRRRCAACGLVWQEMYRLAGYIRDNDHDGDEAEWEAFLNTTIEDKA